MYRVGNSAKLKGIMPDRGQGAATSTFDGLATTIRIYIRNGLQNNLKNTEDIL